MLPDKKKIEIGKRFFSSKRSYQLDEQGISHGKYEDKMYLFEPSSVIS